MTWALLILAIGIILLILEAFVPSGGMIGLLAVGCLGIALYLAFTVPDSPGLGWKFLAAEVVLVPCAMAFMVHLWPKTPLARRIFLKPPSFEDVDVAPDRPRIDHLIGDYGRALTPLRPSGSVDFDGRRLDALSEQGLIAAGSLVRAVRTQGSVLIVREAEDLPIA